MIVYIVHDRHRSRARHPFRTKHEALACAKRLGGGKPCNVFRYEIPHMSVKAAWAVGADGLEDAMCTKVERLDIPREPAKGATR